MRPRPTFADWSVVAPGCKDLRHSLAANGLTALKNIVFSAAELHHAADAAHKDTLQMHHKCERMFENKSLLVGSSLAPTWSRCHGAFHSLALRGRGRSSTPVSLHLHLLHTDKTTTKPRVSPTFPSGLFFYNASCFSLLCNFCSLVSFSRVLSKKTIT